MEEKYANLTNNPALFRNTYWGQFDDQADLEIIENRNSFAFSFYLQKNIEKPCLMLGDREFDHQEFYRTIFGATIMVVSPYEKCDEFMRGAGFRKLPYKIYSKQTTTYVKQFKNMGDLKRWAKYHQVHDV